MTFVPLFFRLLPFLPLGSAAAAPAISHAELWDMRDIRRHPLALESVSAPRRVPLATAAKEDWMNRGDAWVAPRAAQTEAVGKTDPVAAGKQDLIVEEIYLTAGVTAAGPNRIYCAVARPADATGAVPVVMIFHGGGGHASPALALAAARRHPGMAGVAMDYNGQFAARQAERVTQWRIPAPGQKLDLVPDLRNSPMYHYVTAARRTLDWLETAAWADATRFGAVGVSYGGWVALILAGVDARVKCVTTGVSAGGVGHTPGKAAQQLRWEPAEQRPLWLANYEPLAYAPATRAGVFLQLASNDYWFWITGAARQLAALPGPKGWIIRPNSNHGSGGPELSDLAAPAFMRHVLLGTAPLPSVGEFVASDDGGTYSWRVTGPQPVQRTALYWSPGRVGASARYWLELPAERGGAGWTARVPREFAGLAAQTFVNVLTADGLAVSGPLLGLDGIDPAANPAAPLWSGAAIWDRERGAVAWRMPGGWFPATEITTTRSGGVAFRPTTNSHEFCALTNSVVLASGRAALHRGLRLRLDAGSSGGLLILSLVRNSMNLDEQAWTSEVRYGAGVSAHEIIWSDFKSEAGAAAALWPFDALRVAGTRPDGSAIAIDQLGFLVAQDTSR